jgi:hypothetical protein
MAESADTNNAHTIAFLHAMPQHGHKDCRASTHQWRRLGGLEAFRDVIEDILGPDGMATERTLIKVILSVIASIVSASEDVPSQTMITMTASTMIISKSYSVSSGVTVRKFLGNTEDNSLLELGDSAAYTLYNCNAFMSQDHVIV